MNKNIIAVDINDADAILSTDFNDIEKTIRIKSKDAYTLAIDKYNELKVCLKDLSQIEIQHLVHRTCLRSTFLVCFFYIFTNAVLKAYTSQINK